MTVKEMREILSLYPGSYEVWFEITEDWRHKVTEYDVDGNRQEITFNDNGADYS